MYNIKRTTRFLKGFLKREKMCETIIEKFIDRYVRNMLLYGPNSQRWFLSKGLK